MTALEFVQVGATTTLQDGGRRGHARHGVPRSGPVDVLSHRLAARLAGIGADEVGGVGAVEVGPRPCTLRVADGPLGLALAGDGARLVVDGSEVPAPCVVVLPAGTTVEVRARTWAYVVASGRLDVAPVLGSRSHHPRSGLGPALQDGSRIAVVGQRDLTAGRRPAPRVPDGPLLVLPAPQTGLFTDTALTALTSTPFRTTTSFDRMGHLLEGPELRARAGHDIVSDGVVAGAVQVPGDGRATVLTADHQTTGGYPKIAVLSTVALARFVRLPPWREVRFAWGEVAAARRALRDAHARIEECVDGPVDPTGLELRDSNLIGGVVDGAREGAS